MVTIHRASGLRVVIYVDDHEPAHVHVFGDGAAKIDLAGASGEPVLCGSTARAFLRDGERSMAELKDDEIDAALARGRAFAASEPRAVSARYDAAAGRVVVDLANGCTFGFPARRVQGLETATDAEIAAVEVLPQGGGLHWERRNVDISLPGLMAGVFGTRAHMARLAGQATSPAKAAAARANGAKGGRPRKAARP